MNAVNKKNSMQNQALKLVKCLWEHALQLDEEELSALIRNPCRVLFVAAESGNVVFLAELIRAHPDLIWKVNSQNQSLFHVAVRCRQESVLHLIYEIGAIKDLIAAYRDEKGNNMLHLAGKLGPPNRLNMVSGAALQMQRELLWFKVRRSN